MKKRIITIFILIIVLFSCCFCTGKIVAHKIRMKEIVHKYTDDLDYKNEFTKYNMVDSHMHFYDFNQETDGFDYLIDKMNIASVSSAVIFGMPLKKQFDDSMKDIDAYRRNNSASYYYYSATDYKLLNEYEKLSHSDKRRFYPFICGINPNDRYSAKFLKELLSLYKNSIYGIGEIICRHDDLTKNTLGSLVPTCTNLTMLEIYDLAASYDIPIILHNNITEKNLTAPLYIDEIKNALSYNKNTKIIWAHAGVFDSVKIDNYNEIIRQLLDDNENLYIDISWKFLTDYIYEDLDNWVDIINEYPMHFVIGTDTVGYYKNYVEEINKFDKLLLKLDEETRENLMSKNILNILNKVK